MPLKPVASNKWKTAMVGSNDMMEIGETRALFDNCF